MSTLTRFIKGLFTPPRETSTPVPSCLEDIKNSLIDILSRREFHWVATFERRFFECLILSRFFLEYSLSKTFSGKIPEKTMNHYMLIIKLSFDRLLKLEKIEKLERIANLDSYINTRLFEYGKVMLENNHPECWQILAANCIGIDYRANKDLSTFISAGFTFPEMLIYAQDTLKLVIEKKQ